MATIDLHLFERDLANIPGKGSSAPPRTIKAKDLDENNKKLTLLPDQSETPAYTVEYTQDGTRLKFEGKEFDVCENGTPVKYKIPATKV
jgi:hypothetical protein